MHEQTQVEKQVHAALGAPRQALLGRHCRLEHCAAQQLPLLLWSLSKKLLRDRQRDVQVQPKSFLAAVEAARHALGPPRVVVAAWVCLRRLQSLAVLKTRHSGGGGCVAGVVPLRAQAVSRRRAHKRDGVEEEAGVVVSVRLVQQGVEQLGLGALARQRFDAEVETPAVLVRRAQQSRSVA
eukprot:scaffold733_cov267-Pinguiococcus_pyrenoidosus.AAC.3